jgi:hypothetical protein
MTTSNSIDDMTPDEILAAGISISERLLAQAAAIEKSRDEQPARLAKARAEADEARGLSLIEEPFENHVTTISDITGSVTLALPNITAKETFGARLAFDILDCGDDFDRIHEVQNRYFGMVDGDPALMFLIAMSALATIASVVVPQMLDDLEERGSNYDARVMLAQARQKAWGARIDDLKDLHLGTDVKAVDGFDIAAHALDDEDQQPW